MDTQKQLAADEARHLNRRHCTPTLDSLYARAAERESLEKLAFHEAAHVVVGLSFGRRLETAAVIPRNGMGQVTWQDTSEDITNDPKALAIEAAVLIAGEIGEEMFAGGMLETTDNRLSPGSDRISLLFCVAALSKIDPEGETESWWRRAECDAIRILAANARHVVAIAEALVVHRAFGEEEAAVADLVAELAAGRLE